MKYEITNQFPNTILSDEEGTNISLYQPTHRHYPESKKDIIVYKNLLRDIENLLKVKNEQSFIDSIMKPMYDLEEDKEFWNHTLDGIAVLTNRNICRVYLLNSTVREFVLVNTRFHMKPLIKAFQNIENYQILGLSHDNFSLYQGNRFGFSEIKMDVDKSRTLDEVLGKQQTDPTLTQGSVGGVGNTSIYHGQGDKKIEDDKDIKKYFRYVDEYVYENYSKISELPLILVALKEDYTLFKTLSNNSYLMDESIDNSYDLIESDQLLDKILKVIQELNYKKNEILIDNYQLAKANNLGSSNLNEVAKAIYESKVETLLIEENFIGSGKINKTTGKLDFEDIEHSDCGDILDSFAELVVLKNGNVNIITKEKMPSSTGVAAIYRY